jgi:dual specificity tyrosine-phosphorylation-regulated kinase 2/3/4
VQQPQVFDKLLKETFTNISQLAAAPVQDLEHHPSIISACERLSAVNVLCGAKEELKTPISADAFHSTAGSNSIGTNSLQDPLAGISFPTTPAIAINTLGKYLTNHEVSEILSYKAVYCLGHSAEKIRGDLALPNFGYDDERNDYKIVFGDHLDYRYEVLEPLGKGAFGRVLRCFDHKENRHVAVKIIRNARRFHKQAHVELEVLNMLKDRQTPHTVRLLDHFTFRNHVCMAFELLDLSLFDYLKQNRFKGFPLMWVRTVASQLVQVLQDLRKMNVIHCDLKPENILFEDKRRGAAKLIDFGSACYDNVKLFSYIQSRFYRAPEIILGVRYSFPIDMWSLGCLLAELYTGRPLFPGENETDQLLWIMSALGSPPSSLLSESSKKTVFFSATGQIKIVPNSHGTRRQPSSTSLTKLIASSDPHFLDFISSNHYAECLEWIPEQRLTPEQAGFHPFLSSPPFPDPTNGL